MPYAILAVLFVIGLAVMAKLKLPFIFVIFLLALVLGLALLIRSKGKEAAGYIMVAFSLLSVVGTAVFYLVVS
jgi:hypothetical protein